MPICYININVHINMHYRLPMLPILVTKWDIFLQSHQKWWPKACKHWGCSRKRSPSKRILTANHSHKWIFRPQLLINEENYSLPCRNYTFEIFCFILSGKQGEISSQSLKDAGTLWKMHFLKIHSYAQIKLGFVSPCNPCDMRDISFDFLKNGLWHAWHIKCLDFWTLVTHVTHVTCMT